MTGRARAEAALSEAAFQRRIVDTAKLYGWMIAHFRPARTQRGNWITPMAGDVGFPDLVLARRGVVLCAELKRDAGRLGSGQREWLDALGDHGRPWRPAGWDETLEELR